MPETPKKADLVWREFDALVEFDRPQPWRGDPNADERRFEPDLDLLGKLLEVPLRHGVSTQTGLPAKAVDVWLAAELRRAGFEPDEVWPRPMRPRVLPREVALLLADLPQDLRERIAQRITSGSAGGAVSADASILGRAYYKQVDVVISQWARGPELLVSTKRMDSSLSRNAFNRIEESYGDAHNLRGRHPLAAIGYVLVLREAAMTEAPNAAERLIDLVAKLAQDERGYDATAVVIAEWDATPGQGSVQVRGGVQDNLTLGHFMSTMIAAVLDRTPIDTHVRARELWAATELAVREDESRSAPGF
ncbi:hypothetical protein ICW40_11900 [Actinotalea ferrariae]|uniref:hypothetical protein n=1 Tax=Actinotalea ferrariae TaxID=1386098 RepID=UPI001C8BD897|nr:hypothetical protein [Actinotalea ferrariae]MBX9245505.1 hypothetical protein [Actinotalea ferrariae]